MKIIVSDATETGMLVHYPSGVVELWFLVEGEWDYLSGDQEPTPEEITAIEVTSDSHMSIVWHIARHSTEPLEFDLDLETPEGVPLKE
jgi:hypothetical protein